jgi:hypothetical protein
MEKEIKNILDAKITLDKFLEKENICDSEIEGILQILNFLYKLEISSEEINVKFYI